MVYGINTLNCVHLFNQITRKVKWDYKDLTKWLNRFGITSFTKLTRLSKKKSAEATPIISFMQLLVYCMIHNYLSSILSELVYIWNSFVYVDCVWRSCHCYIKIFLYFPTSLILSKNMLRHR